MSHQDIETLTLFDGMCRRVNHRRAALGTFFGGLADGVLVRFLEEVMRHTIFSKEVTVACFTVDSWFGKIVNVSSSLTVGESNRSQAWHRRPSYGGFSRFSWSKARLQW